MLKRKERQVRSCSFYPTTGHKMVPSPPEKNNTKETRKQSSITEELSRNNNWKRIFE